MSTKATKEVLAKARNGMMMAGAGFGLMLASPLFYFAANQAFTTTPEHARGIVGKWTDEDGEVTLAVSPRNMAKFSNFPGLGTGMGAVRWTDGGMEVGWPIKGYAQVNVDAWPSADDAEAPSDGSDRLVANGVELSRDGDRS